MFYPPDRFDFTAALSARWREILDEYRGLAGSLAAWPQSDLHDGGWQVFGLFDFPSGAQLPHNTRRCPVTSALVARHVPGHGAAGFSVLRPGTRIQPHCGYQGSFLRCHLPLVVPQGDCGLEVNGEIRRWVAGEPLVFDDRVEHRAWNLAGGDRVVLLVDFPGDGA